MKMRIKTVLVAASLFGLSACGGNNADNNDGNNHANHDNHNTNNTSANNTSANNTSVNNTSANNTSVNNTSVNNTSANNTSPFTPPVLTEVPATYNFPSRYVADESGVRYNGQTLRHTLIADLNSYISAEIEVAATSGDTFADDGSKTGKEKVLEVFEAYLQSESLAEEPIKLMTDPATLQSTYSEIGGGKLIDKLAGNDSSTDYKDWKTELQGWEGQTSAEGLLRNVFLDKLATQVADVANNGTVTQDPINPDNNDPLPIYVTVEGHDLKQLSQKFLLMSVTFAQASDDYMASGTEGKGLEASNTRSDEAVYSGLEHVWDEGFGYFGAARDFDAYTDQQIADGEVIDTDADGSIDLKSEHNRGAAVNAAKRDLGSASGTDFTQQAFDAFRQGRFIIYNAGDEGLSAEEKTQLEEQRDLAIGAWEKAIAATVVHYINDTLEVMNGYDADPTTYSLEEHAKVWSELKGFALGFQFNENSPMMQEDGGESRFVTFHNLVGDAPVLPNAEGTAFEDYKADLEAARDILQAAYDFDEDDVNGW